MRPLGPSFLNDLVLRPFAPEDLPGLAALYTASVHALGVAWYTPAELAAWAPPELDLGRWKTRLADLTIVIAESGGDMAGFGAYRADGYLDFLYVDPTFVRHGVATRIYGHIEESLRALAIQRVTSHVSLAARSFFDGQGFQLDKIEWVECRGVRLRRFATHKDLGRKRAES